MKWTSHQLLISAVFTISMALPIGLRAELPRYQLTEITPVSTEEPFYWLGAALNSSGTVAGTVYLYIPEAVLNWYYPVAFIWNQGEVRLADSLPSEHRGTPYTASQAIDLNDDGWVILNPGSKTEWWGESPNLVLWDGSSSIEHRNQIPGVTLSQSSGSAINNSRQVLGLAYEAGALRPGRTFVWDGVATEYIFGLGEYLYGGQPGSSYPIAINDVGHVVGRYVSSYTAVPGPSWVSYWPNHDGFIFDGMVMHHLSFIPSGINSYSNVAGYVHGPDERSMDGRIAVYWDGVSAAEIAPPGATSSQAHLINDSNQVVFSWISEQEAGRRVGLWDSGITRDLGNIEGDIGSPEGFFFREVRFSWSMNNSGVVTGSAGNVAFVADNEPMRDLNTLVSRRALEQASLQHGVDINDAGQILVNGSLMGQPRAYLLTPVSLLIDRLEAGVMGVGPGRQLASNVDTVRRHYEAERQKQTCSQLDRLAGSLAKAGAPEIIDDVSEIKTAIDCP